MVHSILNQQTGNRSFLQGSLIDLLRISHKMMGGSSLFLGTEKGRGYLTFKIMKIVSSSLFQCLGKNPRSTPFRQTLLS